MNETSPSPSGRRFRKLRIAWSVVWGVLCVMLIALWVRSHFFITGMVREEGFFFHVQLILAILCSAVAIAPCFRWRFTLRTLLIATTLVAVILGVIVYAVK